ncbi:DUF393 domain-containing protein [Salibacterium salarium]|uniref:DUF393 domain-containing protein n=1 Tax=Salibacterium salarium TaxID=284579 RepID=A0A428N352_9BACI|nr:DUF393 domain-containing protein [Salibacterium salarium]RSL32874.1 DUF393 domain-containing protein [Salibacterium salarium]
MEDKTQAFVVFYDEACGLCQQSKHEIEKWDRNQLITWRSIQDPDILKEYPFLKEKNVQQAMHLLENDTFLYTGYAAVKRIVQRISIGKWLTPLFYLPGIDWAGDRIYKMVAKNRHKFTSHHCDTGVCNIEGPSVDRSS